MGTGDDDDRVLLGQVLRSINAPAPTHAQSESDARQQTMKPTPASGRGSMDTPPQEGVKQGFEERLAPKLGQGRAAGGNTHGCKRNTETQE